MSDFKPLDALTAALGANRHSAIIYADADGKIGFWNAGAQTLFGHSAEEVSGRRIDVIVQNLDRDAIVREAIANRFDVGILVLNFFASTLTSSLQAGLTGPKDNHIVAHVHERMNHASAQTLAVSEQEYD